MPELVPTLEEVFQATYEQSGLSLQQFKLSTDFKVVRWRHIGIYIARKHNYSSLRIIAQTFGYDNHSPAYYGVCRVEKDLAADDKGMQHDVSCILAKLGL
jgi:chromosomal replication initiation ATPase DnaA